MAGPARDRLSRFGHAQRGREHASVSQATITAIVDRLEELGLVQRQRGDRDKRQVILSALPAGQMALVDSPDLLQTNFTERFARLPLWEQSMLLAAAERLSVLMDAQHIDAAPFWTVVRSADPSRPEPGFRRLSGVAFQRAGLAFSRD